MAILKIVQFGRLLGLVRTDATQIDDAVRRDADKLFRMARNRNPKRAGAGYYDMHIEVDGNKVDSEVAVA